MEQTGESYAAALRKVREEYAARRQGADEAVQETEEA